MSDSIPNHMKPIMHRVIDRIMKLDPHPLGRYSGHGLGPKSLAILAALKDGKSVEEVASATGVKQVMVERLIRRMKEQV